MKKYLIIVLVLAMFINFQKVFSQNNIQKSTINSKDSTLIKQIASNLVGAWEGQVPVKTTTGNSLEQGVPKKAVRKLTITFKDEIIDSKPLMDYETTLETPDFEESGSKKNMAYKIINKTTFKFYWIDKTEITCTLNSKGIWINSLGMQLTRVNKPNE
jgi:hypothetical protein